MIFSHNPLLDYLSAFLGGVGVSFTPCVLPLVPVVAGYIGIKAHTGRLKGFTLSFAYVTGVAVTYSLLGLFASLTGGLFGAISSHPLTYIFMGAVFLFLGLSMLDLFFLSFPRGPKVATQRPQGYAAVFLLGMGSGLVVGPCTAPALGAILVYLAAKSNILYGMTVLFSFAYGLGLVLIIAGTFSPALFNLRRSGRLSAWIQKGYAFILLCAGAYFIYTGIRRL
ncbi:MAG: cytochrome c biogenesis protein CcdA [Candidatus Omnitrophica bacterium]|nr:cytochrome c biogenesis protein CcdA [Candidatus Omnitrophota bacterium]